MKDDKSQELYIVRDPYLGLTVFEYRCDFIDWIGEDEDEFDILVIKNPEWRMIKPVITKTIDIQGI